MKARNLLLLGFAAAIPAFLFVACGSPSTTETPETATASAADTTATAASSSTGGPAQADASIGTGGVGGAGGAPPCVSDEACGGPVDPCGTWRCVDAACVVKYDRDGEECFDAQGRAGVCHENSESCHRLCEPGGDPCPESSSCQPHAGSPTGYSCE